jgi:hypothetical protein
MKTSVAKSQIRYRQSNTLYKRDSKGKYIPVNDPWAYDGLRDGHWHVIVRPGSTSIRQAVYPDYPELEAAIRDLEDYLVSLVSEACKLEPRNGVEMSPQTAAAWEHLVKVGGEEMRSLSAGSITDIAQKITSKVGDRLMERAWERK